MRTSIEASLAIGQVLAFLASIAMTRALDPAGRGIIAVVMTWSQFMGWLGCGQLDKALLVLSRRGGAFEHDRERLEGAVRRFARVGGMLAGLAGLGVGTLMLDPLMGVVIGLSAFATAQLEIALGAVLHRSGVKAYAPARLVQPVALFVLSVALVAAAALSLRPGPVAYGGAYLGSLVAGVIWVRQGPRARGLLTRSERRLVLRFGGIAQVGAALQFANARLDLLLLPFLVSDASLGLYAVAASAGRVIAYFGSARVVRALAGDERGLTLRAVAAALALASVLAISAPVYLPLVFGPEFAGAARHAGVLAFAGCAGFFAQGAAGALLGRGRTSASVGVHAVGTATFAVGILATGTVSGAAWSNLCSYIVSLALAEALLRRRSTFASGPHVEQGVA